MGYQITVESDSTTAVLSTEEGSIQLHAEDKATNLTFSMAGKGTPPFSIKLNRREVEQFVKCFAEVTSRFGAYTYGGFGKR